ncbi:MAG: two-component sensor histidine kinase/Tfp pilus assembly protein PilF [Arenicella sp.]|jgi:two-component sensor histidine kinase/Tfp pilus assembly protein PilF
MLRLNSLIIALSFLSFGFGQTSQSENFYLVETFNFENVSTYDKAIVDSCLILYHTAQYEDQQLEAINGIIEETAGIQVWTSYNEWLFQYAITQLEGESDPQRKRLLHLNKAGAINNFGFYHQIFGDLDSALLEYEKALLIYDDLGDQIGSGNARNNIGSIYYFRGDIHNSLAYYEKSLASRLTIGDQRGVANSLNNIGLIFQEEGDVTNALNFYEKSLKIREDIGDPDLISTQLNNIGLCYQILDENITAETYFRRSLKIDEKRGYQTGIAYSMFNIGRCFQSEESYGKALEKYNISFEIFEEEGNRIESGNCLSAMGEIYNETGQDFKAIKYYEMALTIHSESNFNDGICQAYEGLSQSYLNLHRIDLAKEFAEKSLKIAQEIGYADRIKNASYTLFQISEMLGDLKSALSNFQLYKEMSDSLAKEGAKKNFELNRAAIVYDQKLAFQKKQNEQSIQFLEKKDISQQTTITFISSSLCVILLLLIILIFRFRRNFTQKQQIEKQHSEKEILLKEIHHRVKNSLQITTSIIRLQKLSLTNQDAISALESSEARIAAIALVHKLLYQDTQIKSISLPAYLKELIENFSLDLQKFEIGLKCEEIKVETDIATPVAIICSELITNSIKHASSKIDERLLIKINASIESSNEVKLTISDSGKGFEPGFKLEESKGLGFEIVLALCEQIDGSIEIIKSSSGVAFELRFKPGVKR